LKEPLIKKGIENRDIVCRICGNKMMQSSTHLAISTAFDLQSKKIPESGKDIAFAFFICEHCGHVEFFSAKHLGII